jgi:hypothetical protein
MFLREHLHMLVGVSRTIVIETTERLAHISQIRVKIHFVRALHVLWAYAVA